MVQKKVSNKSLQNYNNKHIVAGAKELPKTGAMEQCYFTEKTYFDGQVYGPANGWVTILKSKADLLKKGVFAQKKKILFK